MMKSRRPDPRPIGRHEPVDGHEFKPAAAKISSPEMSMPDEGPAADEPKNPDSEQNGASRK